MYSKLLFMIILAVSILKVQAQNMNWQKDVPGATAFASYEDKYYAIATQSQVTGYENSRPVNKKVIWIHLYDYQTRELITTVFSQFFSEYSSGIEIKRMFFGKSGKRLYVQHKYDEKYFKIYDVSVNPVVPIEPGLLIGKNEYGELFTQSLDKKYVAFGDTKYEGGDVQVFNTEDNTYLSFIPTDQNVKELDKNSSKYNYWKSKKEGIKYLSFSASGNYLVINRVVKKDSEIYLHCNFFSLNPSMPSYHFDNHCDGCIISSDDMTVLSSEGLTDLSRSHVIKETKAGAGFIFLPGDLSVFYEGYYEIDNFDVKGNMSNAFIARTDDLSVVKKFNVSSENHGKTYFQKDVNSSRTTFTTLSSFIYGNNIHSMTVTSWSIPTNLPTAKFKSSFGLPPSKTYSTGQEIEFSNMTYPFRRNATYQWIFGDGETSSEIHPTHTYSKAGTYQVKLVSTSTIGGINSDPSGLVSPEAISEKDSSSQTIVIATNDVEEWASNQEVNLISITPNPFCEGTTINFSLSRSSIVNVRITNALGEEVDSRVMEIQQGNQYSFSWNGTSSRNTAVPTGIYYCTISSLNFTQTLPLIVVR